MPLENPFRLQPAQAQGFSKLVVRDAILPVQVNEVRFAGLTAQVGPIRG